jgi:membrane associated rhomboid family serine protease
MLLLFPTDIETLEREKPYANYVVIGLTVLLFFWSWSAEESALVDSMVLTGWNPVGLVGHLFLHGGFMHLLGNMLFLWAFGNVVCRTTSNRMYPWLYLGCGLGAAVTHLIVDGDPAVGASGAVNGMVGIALAMFPFNRVEMRWVFFGRSDTFDIKLWILAGIWFLMDLWGAVRNAGGVAYAAHLGGLITGLGIGFYLLHSGRVLLSVYDNESLYEKLTGRELERLDDEMEKAEPDEGQ